MGLEMEIFVDEVDEEFICKICFKVPEDPILTAADDKVWRGLVCAGCAGIWYTEEQRTKHRPPPAQFLSELFGLRVRCRLSRNGCTIITTVSKLNDHLAVCEYSRGCDDMGDIMKHLAQVEVDEDKAAIEDIVTTARQALPEIVQTDLSDEYTDIVIHWVSLALFSGTEFAQIERTAEISSDAFSPEYIWKVKLTTNTTKDEIPAGGSQIEMVQVKFGKLHTITVRRPNPRGPKPAFLREARNPESDPTEFKENDIHFGD